MIPSGNKQLSKLFAILAIILLVGGVIYTQVKPVFGQPCTEPLRYSLGVMDERFGISEENFLKAVSSAELIWESAISKDLLAYTEGSGDFTINLIYDYRQEATDRLKSLGYTIDTTQDSYNSLKSRYDTLVANYNQRKTYLDQLVAQFESRKAAYERQVDYWNRRGGASKQEAAKLSAEYEALMKLADQINREKDIINDLVSEINALVNILNNLAVQLKLNVENYNTIGSSRGAEYEEGLYVRNDEGTSINIFEFSSTDQLIKLLAHELGHALGMEHVEDPDAIMYRLNQNQNGQLSEADIVELNRVCKTSP